MIKENVKQLSYRVKPDRFNHRNTHEIHVNNIISENVHEHKTMYNSFRHFITVRCTILETLQ